MGYGETTSSEIEHVAKVIVDAALKVHRATGPGLLESVYHKLLCIELAKRGLKVSSQVEVPLIYDGAAVGCDLRIDLLVEDLVIVEVKSVQDIHPIHKAQLKTYRKLSKKQLGLLINFNVELVKDGITRVIMPT
jgi:GxxExxY protein